MRLSRRTLLPVSTIAVITFAGLWSSPGMAQEVSASGQADPNVSGTGNAGRIAVWKNSTTLGSSVLSQSAGNVGIGTTAPAATLEVNGNAQVDGNLVLGGTIQIINNGGYNTAIGLGALSNNVTGTQNTAIGAYASNFNSGGNNNTAIGANALGVNMGSNNTAVGQGALGGDTGSNNIALGYLAGSNILHGASNNIAIGSPGNIFVNGEINIGTNGTHTSTFIAGIYGSMTSQPGVPVLIDSTGNLGTMSSSRRYKEDIHDMAEASDGLMRLRPVTFRYKKASDDGSKPVQYGLIAEEVAEVYPDLVAHSADGQVETVKYQLLDSMLLNELQKQNATITAQKEQIRSLEERLARVEAALTGTTVTAASH